MTEKPLYGIPVISPSGDWMIIHGVRLIDESGINYGRNHIMLDRIDGTHYSIAHEGDYGTWDPSEDFIALHNDVVAIVNEAYRTGTTADLRGISIEERKRHNPITIVRRKVKK